MPEITIIVPVYKVECYLPYCIDSILAQTFTNWELLLVDDGSPDGSGAICDEYARKDKRIRVFHKENGGVSSARNLGLENAFGRWVTFIDADDYILPDFINGLYKPIEKGELVDFVHGGCCNVKNGNIVSINQSYEDYIGENFGYVFRNFRGLTFSKLFSLENVNKGIDGLPLRFDVQMKMAEDMAFTIDYLMTVKRYAFVEEKGYCYRVDNMNSATKIQSIIPYEMELHSFKHLYKSTIRYVKKFNLEVGDSYLRFQQRGNQMLSTILSLYSNNKNRKERLSHLQNDFSKEEREMLRYANAQQAKKFMISLLLAGYDKMFDIFVSLFFKLKLCLRLD